MSKKAASIRLSGLTKLDVLELEDLFPAGSVQFEEQKMQAGKVGEPTTVAVIIISIAAINAIALWLLKTRKTKIIEETFELIEPNGRRRKETIRLDLGTSEAPKAAIIKEIARLTKTELGSLKDLNE